MLYPYGVVIGIGYFQIHNPFVQALMVFPTQNPFFLFKIILFNKYDFPVLYNPAIDITPNGYLICLRNLNAY